MSTSIKAHQARFTRFSIIKIKDQHLVFDIWVYPTSMSSLLKFQFDVNFSGIKDQYSNFFASCNNLKFKIGEGDEHAATKDCAIAVSEAKEIGFGTSRLLIVDIEENVAFDFTGFPVNVLNKTISYLLHERTKVGQTINIATLIDVENSAKYHITVRCNAENLYYGVSEINSIEFAKIRKVKEELVSKAISEYCEFSKHEVVLDGEVQRNSETGALEYHWTLYEQNVKEEHIQLAVHSINVFRSGVEVIG